MRVAFRRVLTGVVALASMAGFGVMVGAAPASAAVPDTIRANALKYDGHMQYWQLGLPQEAWCADFVKKVWRESGVDGTDRINGLAASLKDNYGPMGNTPHMGDAVLFHLNKDAPGIVSHVAIVTDVDPVGHLIRSVGGNENGSNAWDGVTQLDGPYGSDVGTSGNGYWPGFIMGYVSPSPAKVLHGGDGLNLGQQWSASNNRATLRLQTDGNLVVKDENGQARWGAGTNGTANAVAVFQTDGNLVVYDGNNKPKWSSQTDGNPGATLWIQQDGNVVIYRSDMRALWSTQTQH